MLERRARRGSEGLKNLQKMRSSVTATLSPARPVLKWAGGFVGVVDVAEFVNRAQSDLLAAFLVGLTGMTAVEGGFHYMRKWVEKKAEAA